MMNRQTLTPWLRRINSGVTTLASLIVVTTGAFVLYEATIGDRFLKPQDEIVYEESIAYTFQTYETAWEQIDAAFEDNQGQVNRWIESINHAIAYTDDVDAPAAYQDHKDRTLKELRKITKDSALAADLKEMLNALYELREAEDRREIAYSAYNESTLLNRLTTYQQYRGAQTEEELKRSDFYDKKNAFWEAVQAYHEVIRPLGREVSDNKFN